VFNNHRDNNNVRGGRTEEREIAGNLHTLEGRIKQSLCLLLLMFVLPQYALWKLGYFIYLSWHPHVILNYTRGNCYLFRIIIKIKYYLSLLIIAIIRGSALPEQIHE